MSNQKMIIALLGVVAVLLAVIVGVLVFKGPSTNVASTTDPTAVAPTTANPAVPAASAESGPFDPAKATKVTGTPKSHVAKYFDSIVKGDYKTAYALLPVDKQASYGSADSFGTQLKSYGATGYKMGSDKPAGDTETVEATLNTSGGGFTYIWTFVKYKGAWVVKSRAIGGMGQ
jgi:hypothetical protein